MSAARSLASGATLRVRRHLANAITLARLAAVLPIWLLIDGGAYRAALILFVVAALSDVLDGWVAKITGSRSTFGALLDPTVDKIMLGVLFVVAATLGWTSPWLVALVIGRDVGLALGAVQLQILKRNRRIEPLVIGKFSTLSQFVYLAILLAEAGGYLSRGLPHHVMLGAVVVTAVGSIIAYLWVVRPGQAEPSDHRGTV